MAASNTSNFAPGPITQHSNVHLGRDDDNNVIIHVDNSPASMIDVESSNTQWWNRLLFQATFLLLGVGILVPWNAYISAKMYWTSRLCNTSNNDDINNDYYDINSMSNTEPSSDSGSSNKPNLVESLESTLALVYNLSSVVALAILLAIQWLKDYSSNYNKATEAYQHEPVPITDPTTPATLQSLQEPINVTTNSYGSLSSGSSNSNAENVDIEDSERHIYWMVMIPLSLAAFVFLAQTIVVFVDVTDTQLFYNFVLASLAVCGISGALSNAGIVATASFFPSSQLALNPFLIGQSVAGVVVSIAHYSAAWSEDPNNYWESTCNNPDTNNLVDSTQYTMQESAQANSCVPYKTPNYSMALYFLFGAVILIACIIGFVYIDRSRRRGNNFGYQYEGGNLSSTQAIVNSMSRSGSLELADTHPLTTAEQAIESDAQQELPFSEIVTRDDHYSVYKAVQGPFITIFLTFLVTLSLFPALTSTFVSANQCKSRWRVYNDLFVPGGFVVFNVGDLLGRVFSSYIDTSTVNNVSWKLVMASVFRFFFFPLFFLCLRDNHDSSSSSKWFIDSDWYSISVQLAMAVSNGLLINLAFVHAPSLLPQTTHLQERSSELLTLSVATGLLSGSFLSYPIAKIG